MWHKSEQSNNDNDHNDDNVMHARVWFEFYGRLLLTMFEPWYVEEKHDNK